MATVRSHRMFRIRHDRLAAAVQQVVERPIAIFAAIFLALAGAQIGAWRFHPIWFGRFVATTTVATTLAGLLDRDLGIGYVGGTTVHPIWADAMARSRWRLTSRGSSCCAHCLASGWALYG